VVNFASQARHYYIARKNPFYRHKKTLLAGCYKTAPLLSCESKTGGQFFALTAPLPTDIMVLASEATAFAGWVMLSGYRSAGALVLPRLEDKPGLLNFKRKQQ